MAPPHTTKKTSTTTAQSTSHGGDRKHQKRIIEQVEEEVVTESEEEAEEMDVDETKTPDNLQKASSGELQKLMANMVDAQRKRHQVRKQGVHKAYSNAHVEIQEGITSLFDEHETKASKAYDAQLSRLRDLVKQKERIEKAMATKVAALRVDYDVHSESLRKVIEFRLKELR